MSTAFTITEFLKSYKSAANKEDEALVISRALEHIIQDHEASQKLIKNELKKEMCFEDLVTKDHLHKEILELELKINKQINMAKWQVIGSMLVFFIAGVVAKHFGF